MYKVLAIVSDDLCAGCALTGIDVAPVKNANEAKDELLASLKGDSYGIVIIDESYVNEFDDKTRKIVKQNNIPMIIQAPGNVEWRDVEKKEKDDYVSWFVRQTIGYNLNINPGI